MLKIQLFVYGYTILLLLIILWFSFKRNTIKSASNRIFIFIIGSIIFLLMTEAMGWLFSIGSGALARFANYFFTTLTYSLSISPVLLFFMYFDSRIHLSQSQLRARRGLYGLVLVSYLGVAIGNIWTDFLFTIDALNQYARQSGMAILSVIGSLLVVFYMVSIRKELRSIEGRLVSLMIAFSLLPIVGVLVQINFSEVPAIYTLMSLLILYAYLLIEREDALRDTLTNLATRGQFEQHLRLLIRGKQIFTIMMLDMNDFKQINDQFGHDEGDQALIIVADLLQRVTKRSDYICRYGGDEFMALIKAESEAVGDQVKERLVQAVADFNAKGVKPYTISMSFGILYVDGRDTYEEIHILAEVDRRMYVDKRSRIKNETT